MLWILVLYGVMDIRQVPLTAFNLQTNNWTFCTTLNYAEWAQFLLFDGYFEVFSPYMSYELSVKKKVMFLKIITI